MSIRDVQLHGTGHTVGEVIDEAVSVASDAVSASAAASAEGAVAAANARPGLPTRFLTVTYHHPGNEDGSSVSAVDGVPIPNSTIAEGSVYNVTLQGKVTKSSDGSLVSLFVVPGEDQHTNRANPAYFVYRPNGGDASSAALGGELNPSVRFGTAPNAASSTTEASNDAQFYSFGPGIALTDNNDLALYFGGFSTNTPTDWKMNIQLTPIAP